ncbi:hypothetical protein [Paenibacillus paridis]|uniref:hypothetical protein n=1 Tax=Paenibacillus paridis TaxID=2583376 RepID=UPI001121AEB6|nr:hypothetical protein [Paenibacillus paridis]
MEWITDIEVEKQMMNNEVNGYRIATAACWPSMRLWLFEMAGGMGETMNEGHLFIYTGADYGALCAAQRQMVI